MIILELGNPNLHTWYTKRLKRYIFYFRQEIKDGIKLNLQRIKDWRFRTKENLNLHNRINIHHNESNKQNQILLHGVKEFPL